MIKGRNRNIVVKSQFNINGSRGGDVGKFISDYVSRSSATDTSMAYVPDNRRVPEVGDGVAFTLDSTAISRKATLKLADKVQELFQSGVRAIQQLVISFDHDYLVKKGLVPSGLQIKQKGDYQFEYDDVRLRHAVRRGLQSLVDREGYKDGRMVAAIQHDTMHLHVHAVVYENASKIGRKRGYEEKGVIKQSSFNQLTHDIDRHLTLTQTKTIPTQRTLTPKKMLKDSKEHLLQPFIPDLSFINPYLRILQEKAQLKELTEKIKDVFNLENKKDL